MSMVQDLFFDPNTHFIDFRAMIELKCNLNIFKHSYRRVKTFVWNRIF